MAGPAQKRKRFNAKGEAANRGWGGPPGLWDGPPGPHPRRHPGPWGPPWDGPPGPPPWDGPPGPPGPMDGPPWPGPPGPWGGPPPPLWDDSFGPWEGPPPPWHGPHGEPGDGDPEAWGPPWEGRPAGPREREAGRPPPGSFRGARKGGSIGRDGPEREAAWGGGGPAAVQIQPEKPQPLFPFKKKNRWEGAGGATTEEAPLPLPPAKEKGPPPPPPSSSPPAGRVCGRSSLEKMRQLLEQGSDKSTSWHNSERESRQGSPPGWSHPRQEPCSESPPRLERRERRVSEMVKGEASGGWHKSLKAGEGLQRPGSYDSQKQVAWERGSVSPDGGRQGSPGRRQSQDRTSKRAAWSPGSVKKRWQSPESGTRTRESWGRDEDGVERDAHGREEAWERSPERGGRESPERGGRESPYGSEASSTPFFTPKVWTPSESVLRHWMSYQKFMTAKTREFFLSVCPRPTLPDRTSETPRLNPDIAKMLDSAQEKELSSATRYLHVLQRHVLDMLGPAMTICEMAEEALEKQVPVDPMELREWSRRVLRYIGSLNCHLNAERRTHVLGTINPRLKSLSSKVAGVNTDGMLFAEDKVQLLKEIINRFPQLKQTKKYQPYTRYTQYQAPARVQQRKKRSGSGTQRGYSPTESHGRSKANQDDF